MNGKVMAKFAGFESYFFAISILALISYVNVSTYMDMWNHPPGTTALAHEWSKLRWHHFALAGLVLGPLIILAELAFLWQLIVKKRTAVWMADGQLIFFNYASGFPMTGTLITRVPVKDIDHLSVIPAKPLSCSTVVLHLKNGTLKYIPALLLTENAETLMPRLSAALA